MNQSNAYNFADVVPAVLASGLPVSLATFQEPSGQLTDDGSPVRGAGAWVDVAGYVGIVCMSAPESILRIGASERKSMEEIESYNSNHVWLAGHYPEIATHTEWSVIVDGNRYGVEGAESDSQSKTTRVKISKVTI